MEPFDPFTATLAEAKAQPNPYAMRGPIHRQVVAQRIIDKKLHFEAHPLDGIAVCIRHDLVAPNWLAMAFIRQYDKVLNCEVDTWDEAFGSAHMSSGRHLSTLRLERKYGFSLSELFTDQDNQDKLPRTTDGYKQAAVRLGITEKQVRTLLPKTRTNQRGHKPYTKSSSAAGSASDPFSIASTKGPKN